VRLDGYVTGGWFQVTGQNSQESGFTCAIGTDDAVAVACGKLQIYVLKQVAAAEV
jgi:hypothetical protein